MNVWAILYPASWPSPLQTRTIPPNSTRDWKYKALHRKILYLLEVCKLIIRARDSGLVPERPQTATERACEYLYILLYWFFHNGVTQQKIKNCDFSASTDRIFKNFFLSERASGAGSTYVTLINFRFIDRSGYRFTFARNSQNRVTTSSSTTERDRRILSSDLESPSNSAE